ncbi:MAG: Zn-ribbon domain-containing OB-fold protein [Chloroflexi bacterium]|nr:Zn-ribbon domain-containing OB-fold protein [Chloroflexota bacterium]
MERTFAKPWKKPMPSPDDDIAPMYEGLKKHEFRLCHCKKCGAWYWPATDCMKHDSEPYLGNMEWAKASGKGKVFTFNVHYRAFHPGFVDELPYVYAMIELDEGPMITSNIIGCDPKEVKVGMPVEVVFQDINDQFTLPMFRPAQ